MGRMEKGKPKGVTHLKNQYTKQKTLEAHRNKKRKRIVQKRMAVILAVGFTFVFLLGMQLIKSKNRAVALQDETTHAQSELDRVMTKQDDLKYYIGLLEDEEYIAKLARNEYYLSEENELIFTFPKDTRPSFSYEQGVEGAEENGK